MDGEQSKPPRRFKNLRILVVVALLLYVGWRVLLPDDPFPTPGQDSLKAAVAVKTWDREALLLEDGRRLPLPGLKELPPTDSVVLRMATRQGVETDARGRVFGLVPASFESPSDDRHPRFRVDLSRLLLYTEQGVPERPLSEEARRCRIESPTVSEKGYEAKQFVSFRVWNDLVEQRRLALTR
jgi:hypothetical protein